MTCVFLYGFILKEYGNIFLFGLSIRTFEITVVTVVTFFVAYLVSELIKDNSSVTSQHGRLYKTDCQLVNSQ